MKFPASTQRSGYVAALVVIVCWSGFNIVSRLGGRSELTPFDLAALRFGIAALLMMPLFVRVAVTLTSRVLYQYACIAMTGSLGYALFAYNGFSLAPAAHAGVLVNGGIPVLTAVIGWLVLGKRPSQRTIVALAIAVSGIVMIGLHGFMHPDLAGQAWLGDLFFLGAAFAWAIAGMLMRHWQLRPVDTTAMMVGLAACVYLPVFFIFLPSGLSQAPVEMVVMQGVYQGIVAATFAGIFYNHANQSIGPQKASLMLALVPGVTALAAVPLLNEPLTLLSLLGVVLVSFGAVMGATQKG